MIGDNRVCSNKIGRIGKIIEELDLEDGRLSELFWSDCNFVDLGDIREPLGNREKNSVARDWGEDEFGKRDRVRENDAFGEMILDGDTASDDYPPADLSQV